MTFSKQIWSNFSGVPLSVESVGDVRRCQSLFRVNSRIIPKSSNYLETVGYKIDVFVENGKIIYSDDQGSVELSGREFVSLEAGSYAVTVPEDGDVKIIVATYAPTEFVPGN